MGKKRTTRNAEPWREIQRRGAAIGENTATGKSYLGQLAWWGHWLAEKDVETLKAICVNEGMDPNFLPEPPDETKAFRRSAKAAEAESEHDNAKERTLRVESMVNTTEEITYSLSRPVLDDQGRRTGDWRRFAKVSWFPRLNKVDSDHMDDPTVRSVFDKIAYYRRTFISEDFKYLIDKVMTYVGAVPLVMAVMSNGAEHQVNVQSRFVPAWGVPTITALRKVLGHVPGSGFSVSVVADDEEGLSRQSYGEAAETDLTHQIAQYEEAIQGWEKTLGEGGLVRSTTLLDRIEKLADIGERAESLAGVLKFKSEEVTARIDAAREKLADLATATM